MKLHSVAALVVIPCGLAVLSTMFSNAAEPNEEVLQPVVVEESMHEFMEYVYQPTFHRLKASLAATPTQNSQWKAIKSDALILSEATNLLFGRGPEEDVDDWRLHSVRVRAAGAKLYASAKKKDVAASRTAYKAMIQRCNACHQQFADGEHQLEP